MSDRSGRAPSADASGADVPDADALKALCDRYGLETNPFAPAPERFYGGGQRQQSLDSLRHLCAFGDMFLTVAGAPGSGRTRLLTELVRQEKPNLDFHPLSPFDCASVAALALALAGMLLIARHTATRGTGVETTVLGLVLVLPPTRAVLRGTVMRRFVAAGPVVVRRHTVIGGFGAPGRSSGSEEQVWDAESWEDPGGPGDRPELR